MFNSNFYDYNFVFKFINHFLHIIYISILILNLNWIIYHCFIIIIIIIIIVVFDFCFVLLV